LPREQKPGFRTQKARHKNKGDETAGADYRPTITTACRESQRALATYDHTNGSGIQFRAGQDRNSLDSAPCLLASLMLV